MSVAAIFPFAAAWVYLVVLAGHESGPVQAAYGAAKVVQFVLPAIWVTIVCRQKLRLPMTRTAGVKEGLLLGVAVVAGMLLMYFLWLKPQHILAESATMIRGEGTVVRHGQPRGVYRGGLACFRSSIRSWKNTTGDGSSSAVCGAACRWRPRSLFPP